MEYIYGFIINNIIKDFKGIALPVETDKQIFVFDLPPAPIKPTIVFGGIKSPANIRLAHTVLEGGGIELYGNIHDLSISHIERRGNTRVRAEQGRRI
jgi:hypothetical protein